MTFGPPAHAVLLSLLIDAARVEVTHEGALTFEAGNTGPSATHAVVPPVPDHAAAAASGGASGSVLPVMPSALSRAYESFMDLHLTTPAAFRALAKSAAERGEAAASPSDAASADSETRVETDEVTGVERTTVPAFRHLYHRESARHTVGVLVLNPRMVQLLQSSAGRFSRPTHKAMLVPPRPWTGPSHGGYLRQRAQLVRVAPGTRVQLEAVRTADMPRVYEALTALGNTPWRVNPLVLRILKEVWALGGGLAEMPPRQDVPLPTPPSEEELALLPLPERAAVQRRHHAAVKRAYQLNANRHSLRCDLVLKLHEAESFAESPIWFPWNVDFRGVRARVRDACSRRSSSTAPRLASPPPCSARTPSRRT